MWFTNVIAYYLGTIRGALFPFIGEGIFSQDGGPWRHSRELLRRPFLKTHYQNLKGFIEPISSFIASLPTSNVVDLQPLFFRFTLATTTALIFGQPVESFENEEHNTFANSFNYASTISALRMRLIDFYWAYNPSRYISACKDVKDYADGFVKRAMLERTKDTLGIISDRYAFIEDLYTELQDPELVRDQLIIVLLAGRDTTACLLSWALWVPTSVSAQLPSSPL